ncbi:MAG TPA: MBOAT family O-acyltransferase [Novimethylophilus sp.]|uniref:MBOAT family O-acyltransferase n=1 Tax=Novimethylophilus sp. TaxID=2137426 RepID=UPI002F4214FA
MLFNSLTFLIFSICVFGLFWLIPKWPHKKWLLLIASYLFYAAWNPPYILLLFLSTTADWWLARLIGNTENSTRRRALLFCSLTTNLIVLGYFKYGNFLLENFNRLLAPLGLMHTPPQFDIVLPIGISFYTFASLSYTIDVYRKQIRHDWRLVDYALFVSFFPHLMAGPIVRASCLLPQIENPKLPTQNQVGWGLAFVCMGLFVKVVLADAIFAPVVDEIYAAPSHYGAFDAWAGLFSFSGQIYYDFSGYSLCAIGLALCFGFSFPDNFHHPYAAKGFSDFWRRWHISLSTWLRDYLYIPMGGNRYGEFRTIGNLLITMLIGGLWHGASWMFVLWGGLHGVYLFIERLLKKMLGNAAVPIAGEGRLIEIITFIVITVTWIPFRAETPNEAIAIAKALMNTTIPPVPDIQHMIAVVAMLATLRWHIALRNTRLEDIVAGRGLFAQVAIMSTCLIGLFLCSGNDPRSFIYFQF